MRSTNLPKIVTAKSIGSCFPQRGRLVSTRKHLAERMAELRFPDAEFWVSEYSIGALPYQDWIPEATRRELLGDSRMDRFDHSGIDAALWTARVIHTDLQVAKASAWHWGAAVGRSDSALQPLILLDSGKPGYRLTKTFWAFGHWSFFVRPGMAALNVERGDGLSEEEQTKGVMCGAFIDRRTDRVVVNMLNMTHCDREVQLALSGLDNVVAAATRFILYITDSHADMAPFCVANLGSLLQLPKRCVVTAVADLVRHSEGAGYCFVACSSGRLLEVPQGNKRQFGVVTCGIGSPVDPHEHQVWRIIPVRDCVRVKDGRPVVDSTDAGHVRLQNTKSGLFLAVVQEEAASKSPVYQVQRAESASQLWKVHVNTSGSLYLAAHTTGHVLEGYGSNVRVSKRDGCMEQLWRVVREGFPVPTELGPRFSQYRTAIGSAALSDWAVREPPPPVIPRDIENRFRNAGTRRHVDTDLPRLSVDSAAVGRVSGPKLSELKAAESTPATASGPADQPTGGVAGGELQQGSSSFGFQAVSIGDGLRRQHLGDVQDVESSLGSRCSPASPYSEGSASRLDVDVHTFPAGKHGLLRS
eukprot:TRINITY_DN18874_c0_g1_i1.p1 TRINITY_DN18874_c0_g1~~TRINITY_DN18874_c0_g1_i1.p1  ORF type:complete len:585 (+),score=100.89 TRINITY_DN18874_c0_g1_i1:845-2599(+)